MSKSEESNESGPDADDSLEAKVAKKRNLKEDSGDGMPTPTKPRITVNVS
jgi:hypothetical protein